MFSYKSKNVFLSNDIVSAGQITDITDSFNSQLAIIPDEIINNDNVIWPFPLMNLSHLKYLTETILLLSNSILLCNIRRNWNSTTIVVL